MHRLGSDFVVMDNVEAPYGTIDHVVYNRQGSIYLVEMRTNGGTVKAMGDRLLINGQAFEEDLVLHCRENSDWLKQKLEERLKVKAWVTPVVVFTNAFVEFGEPIRGVYYTNKKFLPKFLEKVEVGSPAGLKLWQMRGVSGGAAQQTTGA